MAEERTLYISNLDEKVTKDLLEEIFTQVGPVESVSVIAGGTRYAFVQFVDEESVLFSIKTMDGLKLYNTAIVVRPRANTKQDRIYRTQHGNARRHSSGPSRRESHNDYASDYQPYSSRRTVYENTASSYAPSRYHQTPGHYPLHSSLPFHDSYSTPDSHRQRIVGGYYTGPRSTSSGHKPNTSHRNGNTSWR